MSKKDKKKEPARVLDPEYVTALATIRANPALTKLLIPKMTKYIPHKPTPKQQAFLLLDGTLDVFYGGAVGGGKSDALLMAALQYVDVAGYSALICRNTYRDLFQPDSIGTRAKEWLMNTDAKWNEKSSRWTFPSGATLTFGYLDKQDDHFQYQSAAYQFVGMDEASAMRWQQMRYLFSRMRRLKDSNLPIRFRAASNPGGISHLEIKEHYIDSDTRAGRVFISARLEDNPYLDQEEYEHSLRELDHITRKRLREGNWEIGERGSLFRREWLTIVNEAPVNGKRIRFWDLAATDDKATSISSRGMGQGSGSARRGGGKKADRTAGARLCLADDGRVYIEDVRKTRSSPLGVEKLIAQTAELDTNRVAIRMEEEGGASGKTVISYYQRQIIPSYDFRGQRSTGPKEEYARPMSAGAEAGNLFLVRGAWNAEFLDELEEFPLGAYDDQVDAASKAYCLLVKRRKRAGGWGRRR